MESAVKSMRTDSLRYSRILFVSAADWAFRAHRLSLARWLINRGATVGVLCPPGEVQEELEAAGLEVFTMDWSRERVSLWDTWRAARKIRAVAEGFEADVVHCVSVRCVLLGWIATMGCGQRRWRMIHHIIGMGSLFSEKPKGAKSFVLRAMVEWALKRALQGRRVTTVFQNGDDELYWCERAGLRAAQYRRVPGSIEWQEGVSQPEPESGRFRVLFVGRMLEDKGVRELFEAWQRVWGKDESVDLVLCGDVDPGNPRSLQSSELAAMATVDGCEWLGHRGNVLDELTKSHVLVLPSYREGFPRVVLEAGLANRAVIVTDVPGCREVVQAEKSGWVVPAQNVGALANAIETLRNAPQRRDALARGLRARVQREFSDAVIHPRWGELYGLKHD